MATRRSLRKAGRIAVLALIGWLIVVQLMPSSDSPDAFSGVPSPTGLLPPPTASPSPSQTPAGDTEPADSASSAPTSVPLTVSPATGEFVITTLDAVGDLGRHTSIAVGADGLGLISYFDDTKDDLKVAHCRNVECAEADISVVDSAGDVGRHSSIAIGEDGLGLISYRDETNETLKVAHCEDLACTSATFTTVDASDDVGLFTR